MPAVVHSALLCDEVRQENNGKYMVIGAYTLGVSFPRFPVAATFSMMCLIEIPHGANDTLSLRLYIGDDLAVDINGTVDIPDGNRGWVPISLPALSFPAEATIIGKYKSSAENEPEKWQTFYAGAATKILAGNTTDS